MTNAKKNTAIAMLTALVIVLQVIATFIKFGGFPITLTLIPIVIAGAIYGIGTGAYLGFIFGIIVFVMVITGADAGGNAMFSIHPLITAAVCVGKGALAGTAAAAVYKALCNYKTLAAAAAAFVCPVVNTGTLYLVIWIFFRETDFEMSFTDILSAFIGVNFLIELCVNLVLIPVIARVVDLRRNKA